MNIIDLFVIRIYFFLKEKLYIEFYRAKFASVLYLSFYCNMIFYRTSSLLGSYFEIPIFNIFNKKPHLCMFILCILFALIGIIRYYRVKDWNELIKQKEEISKYKVINILVTLLYIIIPFYFFFF